MRVLNITFIFVILDQVTKLLVKGFSIPFLGIEHTGMDYGQSISVIGDWFNITFIENPNMAFSMEIGGKLFLSIFAIIASIVIVIYLYKNRTAPLTLRLALAFILAGAMGNLVDRTFYSWLYDGGAIFDGSVVDFIDFNLFTINFGSGSFRFWPIFNIADMAVTAGVILLLIATRRPAPATEEELQDAAAPEQKTETVSETN